MPKKQYQPDDATPEVGPLEPPAQPEPQPADVPDDLRFDTGSAATTRDSVTITIDDMPFVLSQPSDASLYLLGGQLSEGDPLAQMHATMQLINSCLDEPGRYYLRRRMLDPTVRFDDEMLGRLLGAILARWGGGIVPAPNRAERRAQARGKKRR